MFSVVVTSVTRTVMFLPFCPNTCQVQHHCMDAYDYIQYKCINAMMNIG